MIGLQQNCYDGGALLIFPPVRSFTSDVSGIISDKTYSAHIKERKLCVQLNFCETGDLSDFGPVNYLPGGILQRMLRLSCCEHIESPC